jgi:DNA-binding Lrp family transcriptional regulator
MAELNTLRKNKISLEDYNYKHDIENRLLLAQFTSNDLEVLEEILYSSIKIPIRKLAKSVDLDEEEVFGILQKLSKTGLFAFEDDSIVVDKEMRKYFEAQALKFDPEFKPGMEYLQTLLRKVPIHVLPIWYSIPRTSNNIFDSLIEKYLLTPQIFQRYLMDLNFTDPVLTSIVEEVYKASDFKVYAKEIIQKYEITREQFEEYLLQLEFHFVCALEYEKIDETWVEIVTPLHEWKEYACFLQSTEVSTISQASKLTRFRPHDFSYLQDLSIILSMAKKQPLVLSNGFSALASKMEGFSEDTPAFSAYVERLIAKMRQLKLADIVEGRLYALESANDFLDMRLEGRAIFFYRHPLNRLISKAIPAEMITDRNLREAEKSIARVVNAGWVYFDDFIRGVIVPLGEQSIVMLKRHGKTWKYTLPTYSEEELALIKATVLEWLFEIGVTAIGVHNHKDVFCVTSFGQSLFGR